MIADRLMLSGDSWVLKDHYRDHDGLPEVLIALDVGRDADFVDDGGDGVFQRVEPQLGGRGVREDAPHPLQQGAVRAGTRSLRGPVPGGLYPLPCRASRPAGGRAGAAGPGLRGEEAPHVPGAVGGGPVAEAPLGDGGGEAGRGVSRGDDESTRRPRPASCLEPVERRVAG
mgnify:CR=1 FL=1